MLDFKENISLKPYNTFGIEAFCSFFIEINSIEDFMLLLKTDIFHSNSKLIIGGGSNILFTKNFNGLVIKNNIKGISVVSENSETVVVKANAGENWHEFVMWCINKGYCGLENLSLIPGCVGASPMQNIGAYGVEIKNLFYELEAINMNNGKVDVFNNAACEFGYRESVFKTKHKGVFFITSVSFILTKTQNLNTSYGAINSELEGMKISTPTIKDVSDAVISIRNSKLPNPREVGNAGSFFKNPEVPKEKHEKLKLMFENLVSYSLPNGNYKLAAGWLIEQCDLKGYEKNGAAIHTKQALVLINKNNCNGLAVLELSNYVIQKVFDKFGVSLEREVNII